MAKNVADLAVARRNGNHKGAQSGKVPGLRFERFFTPPGSHAFDLIEGGRRTAGITGEKGQVIDGVVDALAKWGREGGYFAGEEDAENWAEELRFLLVTQHASFNSPVWFNIGVPGRSQQGSACFINSVQDSM